MYSRHWQDLADRLAAAGGEKVVSYWLKVVWEVKSPASLQELVEVVVLAKAAVQTRGMAGTGLPGGHLSASLAQYATLLAGQGSLATALSYLGEDGDLELQQLRERLQKYLRRAQPAAAPVQPRQAQEQGNLAEFCDDKLETLDNDGDKAKLWKRSINPDGAVTCGAAVQAAMLTGDTSKEVSDLLLHDEATLNERSLTKASQKQTHVNGT